jgi:Ca2+-binding EF-hand superfamily protein
MVERRSMRLVAMALGAASLGGLLSATVQAQSGARTSELAFAAADTDGSGGIDEAEMTADQAKRFRSLDADKDGSLTMGELVDADPAAFRAVDANGDGRLSFSEVMAGKLEDFGRADRNGDGRLSLDEVVQFEATR